MIEEGGGILLDNRHLDFRDHLITLVDSTNQIIMRG